MVRSSDLDSESIYGSASELRAIGSGMVESMAGVSAAWSGLSEAYRAPEESDVLALLAPAETAVAENDEVLASAARALERYAEDVQVIATDLRVLEGDAAVFRAEALRGYEEITYRPIGMAQTVGYTQESEHVSWIEHTPAVERNNDLLAQYAVVIERLSLAAAQCATELTGLRSGTCPAGPVAAIGAADIMASDAMPWGHAVTEDRTCEESVNHGLGNAAISARDGAAAMVGFDTATMTWSWGTLGATWWGVGDFALSTVIATSPVLMTAISGAGGSEWVSDRQDVAATGWGAMIGWDHQEYLAGGDGWHAWQEDGVAAATQVLVEAGTFLIPGVGAAKGGAMAGRAGALTVRAGGAAVRGTAAVAEAALRGGSHLASGARQGLRVVGDRLHAMKVPGLGGPDFAVAGAGPGPQALHMTPDSSGHLPTRGGTSAARDSAGSSQPQRAVPDGPPMYGQRIGDSGGHNDTAPLDMWRPHADGVEVEVPEGLIDDARTATDQAPPAADGLTREVQAKIDVYQRLIDRTDGNGGFHYPEHIRNAFRGSIFNLENHHRYPVNELHVTRPGATLGENGLASPRQSAYNRVDSIDPGNEIVERKNTQLAAVRGRTWRAYLDDIRTKYGVRSDGVVVADTPSNRRTLEAVGLDPSEHIGMPLEGRNILEVPVQTAPVPQAMLELAATRQIKVVDVAGTEWMLGPRPGTVVEVRADGTVLTHNPAH
ncbi:hypothetical protein [Serinibacter salmoneus]|uniref:hypothetical protein n=1 Tax=Serinibacter salmoneus TaxID=556530 RepID=UPI001179FA95|nr:hypothetical protein [Serinibacter salmoneus]